MKTTLSNFLLIADIWVIINLVDASKSRASRIRIYANYAVLMERRYTPTLIRSTNYSDYNSLKITVSRDNLCYTKYRETWKNQIKKPPCLSNRIACSSVNIVQKQTIVSMGDGGVNQQHLTQQYKVYSQAINHPLPQKIELSAWHKKKTNTSTLIPTRCCYRDRNIENGDRDTRLSASAADKVDWGWDLSANSRWLFGGWVVIYCGWADNVRREVDLINSLGLNLGIELVIEWECGPLNLYNLSLDF